MKMSREESIKKIFDMGFNGNVSSIIDYDVIDYDDGTQLNKALSEYYNCKVTAVHIDECHGVYICHK